MKWDSVNLGSICKIETGKYDVNHSVVNGLYKFFTCAYGQFLANTYSFDGELILLPGNGANVGEVFYHNGKAEAYQRTYVLSEFKAYSKYIYYCFIANWRQSLSNKQYGSATNYIRYDNIASFQIPLPPLPVQERIAAILDEADALRKKDAALLKKYDNLLQSIFYDMFGDPVKNEKGWEVKKLGELSNKISSGSTPSRVNDGYYGGNILWVKTTEVNNAVIMDTEEKITPSGLKNSSCKLYPVHSIIIAMYGQGKTRGKVALLGREAATNQACAVIPPSKNFNPIYLLEYLKCNYKNLRELGRGGNQPNLNIGIVKEYPIICPSLPIQNAFAEIVNNINTQKQTLLTQQAQSESLFQSLMQRAFKGELVG